MKSKKNNKAIKSIEKENKKPPTKQVIQKEGEPKNSNTKENKKKEQEKKETKSEATNKTKVSKNETKKNEETKKETTSTKSKKTEKGKNDQKKTEISNKESSKKESKTKTGVEKKEPPKMESKKEISKNELKKNESAKKGVAKNESAKKEKSKNDIKEKINEETEKKMLEGQEHITENKNEDQENKEIKEEPKVKEEVIPKTRESYLHEKIEKMNINKKLLNNIQKNLEENVKSIINKEEVKIPEKIKNLKKYLVKIKEPDYNNKVKFKEVKYLSTELNHLNRNIKILEENEKLLKSEDFYKVNTSNNIYDKFIQEKKLKSMKEQKEKLSQSIRSLSFKINNIMEGHKTISNKDKVKLFLENFKRDKQIIEIRTKQYMKESKKREQLIQNDLKKIIEKRQKEFEAQDKEAKLKKEEDIKKFKEKEKEVEKKNSKLSEELFLKCKPFIFKKPEKDKNNYLYSKKYADFLRKIEKQYNDDYNRNKNKKNELNYKFEDIDKFAMEYDEKLENRKYEQEQKSMDLINLWAKNREKLPKTNYKENKNESGDNQKSDDEEEQHSNDKSKDNPFKKYGKNVRENFLPEINLKKKKAMEKIIFELDDPKKAIQLKSKDRRKKMQLEKSKPKKMNQKMKLDFENKEFKKQEIISQNLVKKPKKLNFSKSLRTSTDAKTAMDKKLDYLKEKREQKTRAQSSGNKKNLSDEEDDDVYKKSKKWEKEIYNKNGDLMENIKDIEGRVELLEKQADSNEKLLNYNGGFENNPQLGNKVSNLLIDTITAKMNLVKKMYNS